MDEGKAVAAAAGVELREDPWEMNVHATQRGSRHYPSMLEDVEAHRPTEIELITGALVREGERLGVPGAAAHGPLPARQGEGGLLAMRICIVGCGAVGSLFAANLGTLDDVEVWAYDLARDHVDAINRDGLRLTGAGDVVGRCARRPTPPSCPPATSASSRRRRCTPTARSPRPRTRSRTGSVATVQNGIGNEEVLARHCERVIRGTTFPAGKVIEPGVVQWDVKGDTTLRAVRGQARRARRDRAARRRLHARRDADQRRRRRARPAVAQGDLQRRDEPARRADRAHARRASASSRRCAGSPRSSSTRARPSPRAQGIELDSDPEELIDYAARPEVAYGHKASMLQDVEARRQTEVDFLNGGIVDFGRRYGVPTPGARDDLGTRERSGGIVEAVTDERDGAVPAEEVERRYRLIREAMARGRARRRDRRGHRVHRLRGRRHLPVRAS